MAGPSSSEMTGGCALNGALDVRLEEWVSNDHQPTIGRRHDRTLRHMPDPARRPRGGYLRRSLFRRRVWQPALVRAGLADPQPTPHDLRHTAVALMVAAGMHVKLVQVRLGHSSIRTSLDTYGHLCPTSMPKVPRRSGNSDRPPRRKTLSECGPDAAQFAKNGKHRTRRKPVTRGFVGGAEGI